MSTKGIFNTIDTLHGSLYYRFSRYLIYFLRISMLSKNFICHNKSNRNMKNCNSRISHWMQTYSNNTLTSHLQFKRSPKPKLASNSKENIPNAYAVAGLYSFLTILSPSGYHAISSPLWYSLSLQPQAPGGKKKKHLITLPQIKQEKPNSTNFHNHKPHRSDPTIPRSTITWAA